MTMKTIWLKVTSAIVVGGEIAAPGELVEVTESEAKNLLHRGKAELATAEDLPVAEDHGQLPETPAEIPSAPAPAAAAKVQKPARKGK